MSDDAKGNLAMFFGGAIGFLVSLAIMYLVANWE